MSLEFIRRKLSDRFPIGMTDLLETVRQELFPLVKEIRERYNTFAANLATGPFDFGVFMCGTGAPIDPPSAARAIYIDLAGGALTTLFVWNGIAWEAK